MRHEQLALLGGRPHNAFGEDLSLGTQISTELSTCGKGKVGFGEKWHARGTVRRAISPMIEMTPYQGSWELLMATSGSHS